MLDPAPEAPSSIPVSDAPLILPAERVGALFEVLLCSGFPTQILLIALLTTLGMRVQTSPGTLSPAFVITLSLLDTVILVGLIFYFIRARGESPRGVLLGPRPAWRETVIGLVLIPLALGFVVVIVALILTFAPQLHNVPRTPFDSLLQTRRDAVIFAIVAMVSGGVREEIQRGFILWRFDQYLGGGWVGIVAFSVVFGLGHLEQGYDAAITTGLLGAAWGVLYLVRRSIVAPMVSHAGFNLAQLVKYMLLAGRV